MFGDLRQRAAAGAFGGMDLSVKIDSEVAVYNSVSRAVLERDLMTIEQVRRLYEAQPFQPFVIHLADGREVPVLHREFIMAAPSGRTIVVCQPDDTFNIVDLLLVTDLEIKPANGSASKRRKR